LQHTLELNAVVLIADVMRWETHHNLLLHNRAARCSAGCFTSNMATLESSPSINAENCGYICILGWE
jgi:hypothetical protein